MPEYMPQYRKISAEIFGGFAEYIYLCTSYYLVMTTGDLKETVTDVYFTGFHSHSEKKGK